LGSQNVSPLVLFGRLMAKVRLRHLQLLVMIDELKSLQKAAQFVGLSQPAATHALAELESLVGGELFDRHSRGMRASTFGELILPLARNVIRSMEDCAEAIATRRQGAEGFLRIGANGAAISALVSKELPGFNSMHPEVVIDVVEVGNDALRALTDERSLDLLVTRTTQKLPDGFNFLPLVKDYYVLACGAHHPLVGIRPVTPADLETYTWLMPPPTAVASKDFHSYLDALEISPTMCWVGSRNLLILLSMLETKNFLAFVPYNTISQFVDRHLLSIIDCPVHVPLASIGAVYDSEHVSNNAVAGAFINYIAHQNVIGC